MALWHHPESDSYFIAEPGEWQNGADGALCNDVSDMPEHIKAAKAMGVIMENAPDLRTETRRDNRQAGLQAMGEYLEPILHRALRDATRTCLTCDHFSEARENCNKYGGRPPARVIAFGCSGYEDDIPF